MASSMFVKFGNIEGECEDWGHEGWCEITSLKQAFTIEDQDGSSAGKQTAKHEPIEIKKIIDRASMELLNCCRDGTWLEEVVIECVRALASEKEKPEPENRTSDRYVYTLVAKEGEALPFYFQIKLEKVIVKEFEYRVDEGNLVTEELKLVARAATYSYRKLSKRSGAMIIENAFGQSIELKDDDFKDPPKKADPTKGMHRKYRLAYKKLNRNQRREFDNLESPDEKKAYLDKIMASN